jgi:hypothetical protein
MSFGLMSLFRNEEMVAEQEFEELIAAEADDLREPRSAVTVMGHADHVKFYLRRGIRQENVAEGEVMDHARPPVRTACWCWR